MNDDELLQTVGERVWELRQAMRWSQDEVTAMTGLHRTDDIGNLEHGECNVSLVHVHSVTQAFTPSMVQVFKGVGAD